MESSSLNFIVFSKTFFAVNFTVMENVQYRAYLPFCSNYQDYDFLDETDELLEGFFPPSSKKNSILFYKQTSVIVNFEQCYLFRYIESRKEK